MDTIQRGLWRKTDAALCALLVAFFVASSHKGLAAQDASGTAALGAAATKAADGDEKRRATIRYGIDAEILELIRLLGIDKDDAFNQELGSLLASTTNQKLRIALFGFFADREWAGAEDSALAVVEDRDMAGRPTATAALNYLAVIRSRKALSLAPSLVKENDTKLMGSVLKLLGRSGGAHEEEIILSYFETDQADESLRQEAIRALGEIGSAKAALRLAAIAENEAEGKATRMAACEALGKIKEPSSLTSLAKAAGGADPNVRASAVAALASFAGAEADRAIVEALRDSFAKTRIEACKAAGARKIAEAQPYLRYKVTSDPERGVRLEACRALVLYGDFGFLRERMDDKKEATATRIFCFGLLARKDAAGSRSSLEAMLKSAAAEKERGLYLSLAKEISGADDAPDAQYLAMILIADKDPLIRIGGIEWARKNRAAAMRAELERLSKEDPAEMIRKRAADTLGRL